MFDKHDVKKLFERCDIYFEGCLISGEHLVQEYIECSMRHFIEQEKSHILTFHHQSICFDVIAVVFAAIETMLLDDVDVDALLANLQTDDLVLYENQRYTWHGFGYLDKNSNFVCSNNQALITHFQIQQQNQALRTFKPVRLKNRLQPYNGNSTQTGARGLRKAKTNRFGFIEKIFDCARENVSSVSNVSSIIVGDRAKIERLLKGISFKTQDQVQYDLLNLITASYYTESYEEHNYAGNSSKNEPTLKIMNSLSTARHFILSKYDNPIINLTVLESSAILNDETIVSELISRKSIASTQFCFPLDYYTFNQLNPFLSDFIVFACTADFLSAKDSTCVNYNKHTSELFAQTIATINDNIITQVFSAACPLEVYNEAKKGLFKVKKIMEDAPEKDEFLVLSYSLLKFFSNAVFPLSYMKRYCDNATSYRVIASIDERVSHLQRIIKTLPPEVEHYVQAVLTALDFFLHSERPPKYEFLKKELLYSRGKRIALIVPKEYYRHILEICPSIVLKNVDITTPNRFDNTQIYEEIILVGNFEGKRFNISHVQPGCKKIILLYDYEQAHFQYRQQQHRNFLGLLKALSDSKESFQTMQSIELTTELTTVDSAEGIAYDVAFESEAASFEDYFQQLTTFNPTISFKQNLPVDEKNGTSCFAIGHFTDGKSALFTEYYKPIVFFPSKNETLEVNLKELHSNDILVFEKRGATTKNMVDSIFQKLLEENQFDQQIVDAVLYAKHWKTTLLKYQSDNDLTCSLLANELSLHGAKRHEVTIRTWLIEDSTIIGPKDKAIYYSIAHLTQDPLMLEHPDLCYNACNIVRKKRYEILKLLGKALVEKLNKKKPSANNIAAYIYQHIDELAEVLELETIEFLNPPLKISALPFNKPFVNEE